jgi:hypothetical protein
MLAATFVATLYPDVLSHHCMTRPSTEEPDSGSKATS